MTSTVQRMLLARVREAFGDGRSPPPVVLIEFQPLLFTRTWRSVALMSPYQCMFSPFREKVALITRDFPVNLQPMLSCLVFGLPSLDELRSELRTRISSLAPQSFTADPGHAPGPAAEWRELLRANGTRLESLGFSSRSWSWAERGFSTLVVDETRESYQQLLAAARTPAIRAMLRQSYVDGFDCDELRLDDALVDEFIALVKEARRWSGRVGLFAPPYAPDQIRLTDQGRSRLATLVSRIETETALPIESFGQFGTDDFRDGLHLHQAGPSQRFTRLLAAKFQRLFAPPR
jgi:hypothetical protein